MFLKTSVMSNKAVLLLNMRSGDSISCKAMARANVLPTLAGPDTLQIGMKCRDDKIVS